MSESGLTHLDERGNARMVDVTAKSPSHRRAVARGVVRMRPETVKVIAAGGLPKGDVLAVARIAGIQGAKKTSELIPLCHPLMIGGVEVSFVVGDDAIEVHAAVETVDRTGVEMEALTACSIASLTIYDMCKAIDKDMVITDLALWEKTGGKSGSYERKASPKGIT